MKFSESRKFNKKAKMKERRQTKKKAKLEHLLQYGLLRDSERAVIEKRITSFLGTNRVEPD